MYRWLRVILFLLPAELAHRLGMLALRLLGAVPAWRRRKRPGWCGEFWPCGDPNSTQRPLDGAPVTRRPVDLSVQAAGLSLPNPIGLAAGLDKNGEAIPGLFALGFGAVEVGTVTPRAQPGNPKPRLFRIPERQALLNRMGFNNDGAAEVAARIARVSWRPGPLGGNLGMNKDTPLERAAEDYVQCAALLAPVCDYLVINASSPNTPGLRDLQEPERLTSLLNAVRSVTERAAKRTPLFLKIAPDLSDEALDALLEVAFAARIDGLIATNTTVQRPFSHPLSSQPGGLSGAPLRPMATETVRKAYARSRGRLTIVGSGGIFSGADAYEKIRAGASWVQLYTALIYRGPRLVAEILRELQALLARDGFSSVAQAVDTEPRSGASQSGR